MDIQQIAILAPPLLLSLTCHEVAHGWVAEKLGDPTARRLGRITLNPIKHLDPIGTLVFFVTQMMGAFPIGWAKPVPVYPGNFKKPRQMMAIVAVAGPLVNVFLALVATFLYRNTVPIVNELTISSPDSLTLSIMYPVMLMLYMGVIINVALAIFNCIPVPPLDGGRIVNGFLSPEMSKQFSSMESFGFIILIAILASGILNVTIFPIIEGVLALLLGA